VEGLSHGKDILPLLMNSRGTLSLCASTSIRAGLLVPPWKKYGDFMPAAAIRQAIGGKEFFDAAWW
jgi:hypothetical protein